MFVLGGICPATCEISSRTKWISESDLFFSVFFMLYFFEQLSPKETLQLAALEPFFLCESLCKDSFRGTYTLLDSPRWGEIKAVKGGKPEKKEENTCRVGLSVREKTCFRRAS